MNWFLFAIIALLCWSGSDFFSKIGCRDASDKYSHLKMVLAVGIIMGLHAAYEVFLGGVEITWEVIWTYLPVSLLYIGSMALGYIGLRYIELSISSPICNASGALVAIIAIVTGTADAMEWPQYLAIILACAGVISLGFVEASEDDALREARQSASNYKYAKSWLALALPIAYCLLDATGTFADDVVLTTLHEDFVQLHAPSNFTAILQNGIPEEILAFIEEFSINEFAEIFKNGTPEMLLPLVNNNIVSVDQLEGLVTFVANESEESAASANVAYELTFLFAGLVSLVILLVKKQGFTYKTEGPKYIGAIFETVGQFAYVMALASGESALAAPIISSYCVVSVLWSRVFLKEKLSWKHYACIGCTILGIIIMGIYDM